MTNQTHLSTRMLQHFLVETLLQNKYHFFILILLFSFGLEQHKAWTQTLGTYPSSMVKSGQNISITPSSAPTNASSTIAYTNTNFMGVLSVDPTTGVVQVTNAQQAGTYTVTVKAFGTATASTTFTLTITDPVCSQGLFKGMTDVSVGNDPRSVAIGDFNADGRQDFAAANSNSATVSIRLGSGPEINVQGNATDIADGDTSPSSADYTDFGSVSDSLKRTFTIQNKGNAKLLISSITSNNALFVITGAPDSVTAGSSATFKVTFFPTGTGVKNATISINNNDCDESVYDFAITGTAICASQNLSIAVTDTSGTTNNDGTICAGANVTLAASGGNTLFVEFWQRNDQLDCSCPKYDDHLHRDGDSNVYRLHRYLLPGSTSICPKQL